MQPILRFTILLLAALPLVQAQAQTSADPSVGSAYAAMAYPYPLSSFAFSQDGRALQMAYMDVPAATAEKGVLLLFHGKNFGSDYWAGVIPGFVQAGFRVVAVDQLGFGKSSKPDLRYRFDDLARNTAALLDRLKVKRVSLIANSMGGMLAVRFAILFPERIERLVLEDPLGLENYAEYIPKQQTANLVALEMAQTKDSYRRFLGGYFPTWKPEYERFVEAFAAVQASPEYPAIARVSALTYQMIDEQPVLQDLAKIRPATLLVIGQKDRTVFGRRFAPAEAVKSLGNFPELGRRAAATIPSARLVEFADLGHAPHVEAPERFLQAVLPFLTE